MIIKCAAILHNLCLLHNNYTEAEFHVRNARERERDHAYARGHINDDAPDERERYKRRMTKILQSAPHVSNLKWYH